MLFSFWILHFLLNYWHSSYSPCGHVLGDTASNPQPTATCAQSGCVDPTAVCESDGICHCKEGFFLDSHTGMCHVAGLKPGESCYGKEQECSIETTCHADICAIKTTHACTGANAQYCFSICDFNHVCKLEIGDTCTANQECQERSHCTRREGSNENKCRKEVGTAGCTKDEDCESNTVCDFSQQCSIPRGGNCLPEEENLCVAGAQCVDDKCQCIEDNHDSTDTECAAPEGKVGGRCRSGQACDDPFAECPGNNGLCHCQDGYVPDRKNSSACRIELGGPCKTSSECSRPGMCDKEGVCTLPMGQSCWGWTSDHCSTGTKCDVDFICRIKPFESCTNDHAKMCIRGSYCDINNVCKLEFGQPCEKDDDCQEGSLCTTKAESNEKKCRKEVGVTGCVQDEDCVPGSVCDVFQQCSIRIGGKCQKKEVSLCVFGAHCVDSKCKCVHDNLDSTDTECGLSKGHVGGQCRESFCDDPLTQCKKDGKCGCNGGFVPDRSTMTCRAKLGDPCKSDTDCTKEATCEKRGVCALAVGQSCMGDKKHHCKTDSFCDEEHICRVDLHQSCLNETDGCRLNTVCDLLNQCKRAAGTHCRNNVDCAAGSHCSSQTNGVCECTIGVSTLSEGICKPVKGMYKGICMGSCATPNSKCVDGRCVCEEGYEPTTKFECEAESSAMTKDSNEPSTSVGNGGVSSVAFILAMIGMALVPAVVVLGAVVASRRKKSTTRTDDAEQRKRHAAPDERQGGRGLHVALVERDAAQCDLKKTPDTAEAKPKLKHSEKTKRKGSKDSKSSPKVSTETSQYIAPVGSAAQHDFMATPDTGSSGAGVSQPGSEVSASSQHQPKPKYAPPPTGASDQPDMDMGDTVSIASAPAGPNDNIFSALLYY